MLIRFYEIHIITGTLSNHGSIRRSVQISTQYIHSEEKIIIHLCGQFYCSTQLELSANLNKSIRNIL